MQPHDFSDARDIGNLLVSAYRKGRFRSNTGHLLVVMEIEAINRQKGVSGPVSFVCTVQTLLSCRAAGQCSVLGLGDNQPEGATESTELLTPWSVRDLQGQLEHEHENKRCSESERVRGREEDRVRGRESER